MRFDEKTTGSGLAVEFQTRPGGRQALQKCLKFAPITVT